MTVLMSILKVAILISIALMVLFFGLSKWYQYAVKKGLNITQCRLSRNDVKLFAWGTVQATRVSKRWLVVSLILITVYIALNWFLK